MTFEFPTPRREELESAAALLRGWLPTQGDRPVRRATPPAPPEQLPPLRDPAANDPQEVVPLTARLEASLAATLSAEEPLLARSLLRAWVEGREAASVLAVTDRRLLVLPDPADEKGVGLQLEVPLPAISSLESCSTIVLAYLKVFVPEDSAGRPRVHTIHFGKTLAAMNTCYLALRRALATTAVESPGEIPQ